MFNLCLHVAYDGTEYFGWQKTSMGPSIEETLSQVLESILGHQVKLQAASRTDAGVHADGQVVNALSENGELDLGQLLLSLNQMLPRTIAITQLCWMPDSFHPSLDAKSKAYRYSVSLGTYQLPKDRLYSWHFPYKIDLELMREAGQVLIGCHDFAAFTNVHQDPVTNTIRELRRIDIEVEKNRMMIEIEGNKFLYRMVRNLVGTLLYVACGKIPKEQLAAILTSGDRRLAGVTAPAHGLTLHQIWY